MSSLYLTLCQTPIMFKYKLTKILSHLLGIRLWVSFHEKIHKKHMHLKFYILKVMIKMIQNIRVTNQINSDISKYQLVFVIYLHIYLHQGTNFGRSIRLLLCLHGHSNGNESIFMKMFYVG